MRLSKSFSRSLILWLSMFVFATALLSTALGINITIPELTGRPGTNVTVPISISNTTDQGIISVELTLTYNASILTATGMSTENTVISSSGWGNPPYNITDGQIVIWMAHFSELMGAGTLVRIDFTVSEAASNGDISPLTLSNSLNEGNITVVTTNGSFTIDAPPPNTLTTSVNPAGSGSVSVNPSGGTYDAGTEVTLTATPSDAAVWEFHHWSGDDIDTSTTNPETIAMDSNKSVTAHFVKVQYTLTTSVNPAGSGSVSVNPSGGTYDAGTEVTLTATPSDAAVWVFHHWSVDLSGSTNPAAITMSINRSVTAHFVKVQYTLTTSVNPAGSGNVGLAPPGGVYDAGTVVQLTANPSDSCWTFDYWSGDDINTSTTNPESIAMSSNKTVTTHFVKIQYTLTTVVVGNGSIQLTPPGGTYDCDTQVQLEANPDPGWAFDHWSVDLSGSANPAAITMSINRSVTAHFVNPVNDPPVLIDIPDRSLDENTSLDNAIDLWAYASDPETSDDGLTYAITGNTNPDCGVSIDANRYIDVNPTAYWNGSSDVTITVTDPGSLSSTDTFTVTVNPVMVVLVASPVDLVVTDPAGRKITKDVSEIPNARYLEEDVDGDGDLDDQVFIPTPMIGDYSIQVIPEQGADPTDTYTLTISYNDQSTILSQDIQIQDIPIESYSYSVFSINMAEDWNLISIPVQVADTSMAVVLQSIGGLYRSVWAYDPVDGWERHVVGGLPFLNTLTDVAPSKGYWIDMSEAADLIVSGAPVEDAIPMAESWNLVGFNHLTEMALMDGVASIDGYYNAVWGYDPVSGWERHVVGGLPYLNTMVEFKPGKGYWIDAKVGCPPWDVNGVVVAAPPSLPFTTKKRQIGVSVSRPELPYTIWGNVEANGVKMADGATVFLEMDGKTQASYRLGSREGYGDLYVLDIPANVISPEARLRVQIDDTVIEAASLPPGNPGQIIHLDLSVNMTPKLSMLYQNYPNPFNPETWIPYQLEEGANVVINIYNLTGQLVRVLKLGHRPAGFYIDKARAAYWDGRNAVGEHVASGVYFYTIQAGEFAATRKTIVVK